MVWPVPSSPCASATESVTGPRTVVDSPPASIRPAASHTPGNPLHEVVAFSLSVTSATPPGTPSPLAPIGRGIGLDRVSVSMSGGPGRR